MDTKEFFRDKEWEQPVSDKITFSLVDYGIKTAGSYLYEYIGKNLYYTFDKLIYEADREGFLSALVQENEGKEYVLRLIRDDNKLEWFLAKIDAVYTDKVTVILTNTNSVLTSNIRIKENNHWMRNLLDMTDFLYFFYEPRSENFYITRMKNEGIFNIYEGTLNKWIKDGFENNYFSKGQKKNIELFKEALENKEYGFEYAISTGYFSADKELHDFIL